MMNEEQVARRIVDGIEARLQGASMDVARTRLYCATCREYLDANPLDADGIVILIHAMADHRLVEREVGA